MTMHGADVQQLAQLGTTLKSQPEVINQMIATVSSAFHVTLWEGPNHDRFAEDWNTTFKAALGRLSEAFTAAGADCVRISQNITQAVAT
jgi:hypothetical protein